MTAIEGQNTCCNAVFCVSFTWQTVKTRVIRLQEVEGQITHDQICVMCIPFILSGSPFQMLATYICDACIITTSRLGLGAPRLPQSKLACERAHLCELGEKI